MDMGVDSLETELAHVSVETKTEGNILLHKENGLLNQDSGIKFGSHGTEETSKKAVNNLSENRIPSDAVDEWPAPKQIHTFYMVKYRSYDDQKTKDLLDQADKELKKINQARYQITEKLRAKRADRAQVNSQFKDFYDENKQFRQIIDEKRKIIEPLHQALGQLRSSNTGDRERSYICSSEEELNNAIKSLEYRIAHESIPLPEEKKIIREIKQLEGTRDKVIANAVVRAKIQDSLGEKDAIQDQVKVIGSGLDGIRKEKKVVETKLNQLHEERVAINKVIEDLEKELDINAEDREKAYEKIREVRNQLDEGNAPYFQNRTILNKARELAASKDVEGLRDLADTEVEKFMSLWSSNKAFRDEYEKRILLSLDMRQLSRDGRMRNPNEKPLVVKEPPPPTESVAKQHPKKLKEDSDPLINQKEKIVKQQKETSKVPDPETTVAASVVKDELEKVEKDPLLMEVKSEKDDLPVENKVDEAKLRELKREEEIAKAKQAQERKKKLAEKAAAKAAIKAQKEAEKKQKNREKKEKKKAAASVSVATAEPTEEAADMVGETETADEVVQAKAAPKTKERKEKTVVKQRGGGRAKGPDSLPKIILKRKKATNYWYWAAALATILVVLLLLSIGGYYISDVRAPRVKSQQI